MNLEAMAWSAFPDETTTMGKSHMGHLSRFRLTFSRSRIAPSNDREMDVIVGINVFYSDLQARWTSVNTQKRP